MIISHKLYVTSSTVSQALQRHYVIGSSTKAAVHKIVKKLRDYPNEIAFPIRSGKLKNHWVLKANQQKNYMAEKAAKLFFNLSKKMLSANKALRISIEPVMVYSNLSLRK